MVFLQTNYPVGEKEDAKAADMEKMLDYIDTLNELDTDGIEPMSHVLMKCIQKIMETKWNGSAETLANAPFQKRPELQRSTKNVRIGRKTVMDITSLTAVELGRRSKQKKYLLLETVKASITD